MHHSPIPLCSSFQRAFYRVRLLQPLVDRSLTVVLFLITNVAHNPGKISRSEADDPVTALPLQDPAIGNAVIDVVGASTF